MESFSYAYIYALASQAGFTFNQEPKGLDNIGIDICVKDPLRLYNLPPCQFYAQVKCVRKTKLIRNKNGIFYGIKKKYYDSLTKSRPYNTILLFVVVVPDDPRNWIDIDELSIIVKHNCYWFCFQDHPLSNHNHKDSKKNIQLFETNLLTPESFPLLMQKIADGEM
ncbi:DUF4365 domain-containing protein [Thermosynechococcaceae cyanobacterium BACA0444]|uniref:DUF4365 domain-containing protein n=1 Tax=Pseudocalidococcus azoricus BACA0444 TaxID=2918990 RepID=A0AAE4JVA2_9CYAN|nr:DUF4365 domain-containing protein [Pseudocalidococcus azoricus]MDS3860130.1 DUF4365 domain-containing protein [Pseudocalidococcus azoricus BACA0444]